MSAPVQGQTVFIPSGEGVLTGTVVRVSKSSIWAKLDGGEYRFTRSQDGQYRLHGRAAIQSSPVLVFGDAK